MSQGNLADFIAAYPGNPQGVSTSIFDCKAGTLVFDTTTGALYRKASALGDNTLFIPAGVNKAFAENFVNLDTTDQVSVILPTGAASSGTTNVMNHIYTPGGNILAGWNIGTQTLRPTIIAAGLSISVDLTDTEGYEICSNFYGATGRPFIVGNDPAFFFRTRITAADVSGVTRINMGFRKAQTAVVGHTSYTDYASVGLSTSGDIKIENTKNNAGTTVDEATDTELNWADTEEHTFEVRISATGVATYYVDGVAEAPTTAFTLDNGDPMIPYVHLVHATTSPGVISLADWVVGYV